jgi:hypothetical protein
MNVNRRMAYSSILLDLDTARRLMVSFTPRPLYPRNRARGTHWIRGWVGPRACLEAVKKRKISCPCRESNPGRPAPSPSLSQLYYTGSFRKHILNQTAEFHEHRHECLSIGYHLKFAYLKLFLTNNVGAGIA